MSRKKILILLLTLLVLTLPVFPNAKLAQTGFKFLSVGSDARGAALCDALTTIEMGSSSLFANPAGMARMASHFDIAVSQNKWIADINHNSYSVAVSPYGGRYGVIGLSFMSVDYGELIGTMVSENSQGYIETGTFTPTAFTAGLGYAIALSDKFSVGGQIKVAGQHLGKSFVPTGGDSVEVKQNIAGAMAYDFGTMFKTGFKSLVFGMSVRNFSNEIKYEEEGFQLPLTFKIGLSMNVLDLWNVAPKKMYCLVSVDAAHPRDYPEQIRIGSEFRLLDTFAIRAGYVTPNDDQHLAFGFGVQKFGASIDYAYTPFKRFDNVQRFTLRFAL